MSFGMRKRDWVVVALMAVVMSIPVMWFFGLPFLVLFRLT